MPASTSKRSSTGPRREPGRLTLIARMGAQKVGERLPPLVEAVRAAGQDAQVLDGLSVGEIVTGAAKGNTQVLAQAHAVAGGGCTGTGLPVGRGNRDRRCEGRLPGSGPGPRRSGHPRREPGRLTLIARMGAQKVGERLPPLVEAVRAAGPSELETHLSHGHPGRQVLVWQRMAADPGPGSRGARLLDLISRYGGEVASKALEDESTLCELLEQMLPDGSGSICSSSSQRVDSSSRAVDVTSPP